MSVIGIDFGNENCYIAVARAGGIETLANEYSQRVTPSYVAFGDRTRDLGVSAKNKQITNLKNTVYGFKRLIGKKFRDPGVQEEINYLPFSCVELPDGGIGIKANYLNEDIVYTTQQITGMLLTKLKEIAETNLKIKVTDCVLSVPSYFNDIERRALLDAAQIAGLDALRLMNETTGVALTYGFYKQDLPEEKPRIMVFMDMGHSALQVTACAFTKGKLKVLATVWDTNVGGRDFDNVLVRYFAEDFHKRYRLDVINNKRAIIRLMTECEKLKKQMSANTNQLPLNIECFMEDKDVSGKMCREEFEKLCDPLLLRVEATLRKILDDSKLKLDEIDSVEVVGGSSRVPCIKRLVQKVFNKEPSTTLNLDEAVARGCALQCAMLSPAFKVRDFEITDVQPYPIRLLWTAEKAEAGEMVVFERFHKVPFYRKLTFMRKEPFTLEGKYVAQQGLTDASLGAYTIKNVSPNPEGDSSKVEIKVNINIHGIFSVSAATLYEKQPTPDQNEAQMEPMEDQEQEANKTATSSPSSSPRKGKKEEAGPHNGDATGIEENMQTDDGNSDVKENNKDQKKPKKLLKATKLPIDVHLPQLTQGEMTNFIQNEGDMILQDKREKERADAKNAVEEYVYEMRNKLSDQLEKYVTEANKESFSKVLNETEDWLYDEGEEQSKAVYNQKLEDLKKIGQPIVNRMKEAEERPALVEAFGRSLQLVRKELERIHAHDEAYSHIDASDVEKVHKALDEKQDWFERQCQAIQGCSLHQNPPVLAAQFHQEKLIFENIVKPILSKPKPKVELPPETNGSNPTAEESAPAPGEKKDPSQENMDMD